MSVTATSPSSQPFVPAATLPATTESSEMGQNFNTNTAAGIDDAFSIFTELMAEAKRNARNFRTSDYLQAASSIENQSNKALEAKKNNYTAAMVGSIATIGSAVLSALPLIGQLGHLIKNSVTGANSTMKALHTLNMFKAFGVLVRSASDFVAAPFRYAANIARADQRELEVSEKDDNFSERSNAELERTTREAMSTSREKYAALKIADNSAMEKIIARGFV